ncbi:MAG TPA: leucyl/phenylalanyl-tRNA--protein transferase [Phycisphaerae bacterium]|nr:leucyl/phenylalanyl-tRNA--protein transferase [Phycisphaerae bacterium]HRW53236.1 leucyl/phenylalanyl-tRNA--protein transferase [Phycisphaerae bacterium]
MSEVTELTPELLISAYAQGVFPMGVHGRIGWFSPDPRGILPLETFHVSRTLAQTERSGRFQVRVNTRFRDVMLACADRPDGTWITTPIVDAYVRLHELGLAHSVEAWRHDQLVGGLYGVALGGAFFGESMFHRERDASKVALVALVETMRKRRFTLLDIQYTTPHLMRFGAIEIPREEYLKRLMTAIRREVRFTDA